MDKPAIYTILAPQDNKAIYSLGEGFSPKSSRRYTFSHLFVMNVFNFGHPVVAELYSSLAPTLGYIGGYKEHLATKNTLLPNCHKNLKLLFTRKQRSEQESFL